MSAPKQPNTQAEKAAIEAGSVSPAWKARPAKLRQKDRDGRWTVKFSKAKPRADTTMAVDIAIATFGFHYHISSDRSHGPIRKWPVTDAGRLRGPDAAAGLHVRTIGLAQPRTKIGVVNPVANIKRLIRLTRTAPRSA